MSITITVTDPHSMDATELLSLASYLQGIAGAIKPPKETPIKHDAFYKTLPFQEVAPTAPVKSDDVAPVAKSPPPPPVPAPAQAAPPAPPVVKSPPPPPGPSELDSQGIPWDARIHSDTRNKNVDGTWRVRRHTDKALVEEVMAELKGGATKPLDPWPIQPELFTPPPPPVPSAPAAVQAPPPPPVPSTVETPITYVDVVSRVMALVNAKKLDNPGMVKILQPLGHSSLLTLATATPDVLQQVMAAFEVVQ